MGFSISANMYLRNCYSADRSLCVKSHRTKETTGALSFADSAALKKAIRTLGDYDFESDDEAKLTHNIKAFIDSYNYTIDSASKSSTKDVANATKHMKNVSRKYASELEKLGFSFDKDGYMSISSSATSNISGSSFQEMFREDSPYMSELKRYSHRIQSRVDIYL